MNVLDLYSEELRRLGNIGRERNFTELQQDGAFVIDNSGHQMLNLSGNDYLGIGARKEFQNIIIDKISNAEINMGSYSSRLLTGDSHIYEKLENCMKSKFSREAALLFNSGYHMNTGIIPAISTPKTIIIADKLVHASIIDGIILSKVKFERFRHNDINHLEKLILKHKDTFCDIIVVVESVYSMDGDTADLKRLVELKKLYPQIRLYVDEAHAIGVRGDNGLGLAEETDTIQDIDLLVGTFGKALASMGGYLITNNIIKRYLIQKCRPLIFSTALPPIIMEFNRLVFENIHSYNKEREILREISNKLKTGLKSLGLKTSSHSNIIPVILGEDTKAIELSLKLKKVGFFVLPIRPPSVPEGSSRIRLSLTSETKDIEKLLYVIEEYKNNTKDKRWNISCTIMKGIQS